MQMANDAAAEKPGSAKYRDNLPRHETNICCRRARRDRISAGCRVQRVVTCNDVEHLRIDGAFISAGDYVHAGRRRLETIAAVEQALREVDVLLYAGAMDPPSQIDDAVETERTYPRQARTPFNITGHPALAMMAGLSSGGCRSRCNSWDAISPRECCFRSLALGSAPPALTRSIRRSIDRRRRLARRRIQESAISEAAGAGICGGV